MQHFNHLFNHPLEANIEMRWAMPMLSHWQWSVNTSRLNTHMSKYPQCKQITYSQSLFCHQRAAAGLHLVCNVGAFSVTRTIRSPNWFIHSDHMDVTWFKWHHLILIKQSTHIWPKPPGQKMTFCTAGQFRLWPHGAPLRATQDQWGLLLFISFLNSRLVLQPEEEMIYEFLITPPWWQRYDQMINGPLQKQENYWRDL